MIHLSQGKTADPRPDIPTSAGLPPLLRQRCSDRQVFSSILSLFRGGADRRCYFHAKKNPLRFERVENKNQNKKASPVSLRIVNKLLTILEKSQFVNRLLTDYQKILSFVFLGGIM